MLTEIIIELQKFYLNTATTSPPLQPCRSRRDGWWWKKPARTAGLADPGCVGLAKIKNRSEDHGGDKTNHFIRY